MDLLTTLAQMMGIFYTKEDCDLQTFHLNMHWQ